MGVTRVRRTWIISHRVIIDDASASPLFLEEERLQRNEETSSSQRTKYEPKECRSTLSECELKRREKGKMMFTADRKIKGHVITSHLYHIHQGHPVAGLNNP